MAQTVTILILFENEQHCTDYSGETDQSREENFIDDMNLKGMDEYHLQFWVLKRTTLLIQCLILKWGRVFMRGWT